MFLRDISALPCTKIKHGGQNFVCQFSLTFLPYWVSVILLSSSASSERINTSLTQYCNYSRIYMNGLISHFKILTPWIFVGQGKVAQFRSVAQAAEDCL